MKPSAPIFLPERTDLPERRQVGEVFTPVDSRGQGREVGGTKEN